LVWIPPEIEEEEQTITIRPPWTEYIVHPPEWIENVETINCGGRWVEEDCGLCFEEITHDVIVYELINEGFVEEIQHPEETQTIICERVITPGEYVWQQSDC
jgi:hypothetical protein